MTTDFKNKKMDDVPLLTFTKSEAKTLCQKYGRCHFEKMTSFRAILRISDREVEPQYQSPTQTPADPIARSQ